MFNVGGPEPLGRVAFAEKVCLATLSRRVELSVPSLWHISDNLTAQVITALGGRRPLDAGLIKPVETVNAGQVPTTETAPSLPRPTATPHCHASLPLAAPRTHHGTAIAVSAHLGDSGGVVDPLSPYSCPAVRTGTRNSASPDCRHARARALSRSHHTDTTPCVSPQAGIRQERREAATHTRGGHIYFICFEDLEQLLPMDSRLNQKAHRAP